MLPQPTTHDWTHAVDQAHLASIRREPERFAPGDALHLIWEVVAYPADEAAVLGGGRCRISLAPDGFTVADEGRGTATIREADGRPRRKPVMSTPDLRFFAADPAVLLPDGSPRRGMSVVAALSPWLEHTNRRVEGSWTQGYRHGVPAAELTALPGTERTGTTVSVRWDGPLPTPDELRPLVGAWPLLDVVLD